MLTDEPALNWDIRRAALRERAIASAFDCNDGSEFLSMHFNSPPSSPTSSVL